MIKVFLLALGAIGVFWLVYFFMQWAINDDMFFDGGWEEEEEDERRGNSD